MTCMRRLFLILVPLVAVGVVAGSLLFRNSGALSDQDLAPVQALVDIDDALAWRADVETASVKFEDYRSALQEGFVPLEPANLTKWEHLVHWSAVADDVIFDPARPEALLYQVENGRWTLMAEVFMLPVRYNYANTPAIAEGKSVWHTHPTACLEGDPFEDPKLGALDLLCQSGVMFPNVMMTHAWVQPNSCGPFATAIDPAVLAEEQGTADFVTRGVSGVDENGDIPGCEPELAERVWPGVTD